VKSTEILRFLEGCFNRIPSFVFKDGKSIELDLGECKDTVIDGTKPTCGPNKTCVLDSHDIILQTTLESLLFQLSKVHLHLQKDEHRF
jgi:hypothetical protein